MQGSTVEYPSGSRERDCWILDQRPARAPGDPWRPHGYFVEAERNESGQVVPVATVFLTNRECPWRCLMCDLWKTTVLDTVPPGAIPAQIDFAFEKLGCELPLESRKEKSMPGAGLAQDSHNRESWPRQIKLYNGGSFFDPHAIPPDDYGAIAQRVAGFERVIVECHPAFVRESCVRFRDLVLQEAERRGGRIEGFPVLEVAMGLETAHPQVLERLNKRMTLEQFSSAAEFLRTSGIAMRAFVLVKPPFLDETEGLYWAQRSVDYAFQCGAAAVSLIPTRAGNGAMEALERLGQFAPPRLDTVERALEYGIRLGKGRVFADLWDLEKFSDCPKCFPARHERLRQMNWSQAVAPEVQCGVCGSGSTRE